ncbi:L,D-transpeptidase [Phreatobacter stygius]|uniref:L,D-transpeptidase n=1 Tax=Phreatobacter stygius TaxID=1940610 RepID=A0A4D7B4A5_9HYPH|nr:L,D-transpeptidase [Phreatobacter stygius]QCI65843.1 L,D-transpeptidase [Phreatobacter stygius]
MRRLALAAALSLAAFAGTSAQAAPNFMIDPDTRQPMMTAPLMQQARSQAQAIPREVVSFTGAYAPGTVVVDTNSRRLFYVLPGRQAISYGIGVGRPGFEWGGSQHITRKQEWPDWRPPVQMLQRRPDLPRFMAGGPQNPLGARAMYLGSSLYRIHGSNEPHTIGQAVSSGCIRMLNDDVVDLYNRVQVGTRVVVLR